MSYTNGLDDPTLYFNTKLYTGDGDTASNKTGVGFQPDWTWIKKRGDDAEDHALFDIVRGVSSPKLLNSNGTGAEETHGNNGYVSGFVSDGFSVATNGTSSEKWEYINTSSDTYVAWNWLASNTTASNTDGSITSTVSANTTSGFSIVSYTGTGATATIGHGLGVTPQIIIAKKRDTSGTDWITWGSILGGTTGNEFIKLNQTNAKTTGLDSSWFNNTAPTSSVFTVGTQGDLNGSSATYIAYCFAEKKGFSKFGSYTGNGNADGTFVYTGFSPSFVMIKSSSLGQDWFIHDNKRSTFNVSNTVLLPNTADLDITDTTVYGIDMVSNGFKVRGTHARINQSGSSYIYMCFAENPFVTSTGIPTTAR